MAVQTMASGKEKAAVRWTDWLVVAAKTALLSVAAVLITQALVLAAWPEIALFKPLDSYARSALFTLVPALGATAVFAWLARRQARPEKKFVVLSAALLLLSFIPDYLLPVEHKTLLASSAAAFMHLVAGVVTVAVILVSYRRKLRA